MKLCICADPENCTEVPENTICKKDHLPSSPPPPVKGKLHICRWMGSWCVIGDSHAPGPATATYWFAFDHVKLLEEQRITGITSYHLGREMFSFVDDKPPQMMVWTDDMPNDPTRWG
jgi:hypothetical protein